MPVILVVDDHAQLLSLLTLVLERAGYQVITAVSAAGGLQAAFDRKIDMLIADMVMPGVDSGEDLAEALSVANPGLKVLLISGYPQEPVRSRPGWGFLWKPFDPRHLVEAVREALAG